MDVGGEGVEERGIWLGGTVEGGVPSVSLHLGPCISGGEV